MIKPDATPRYLSGNIISVLLPLPLGGAYDYLAAEGLTAADGDFVTVPLGKRQATGVVWGPGSGKVEAGRLKRVINRLDAPPLSAESRRFIDWVAGYTLHPAGAVIKMAMSVPDALYAPKPVAAYAVNQKISPDIRLTPARQRVLDVLASGPSRSADRQSEDPACPGPTLPGRTAR